MSPNSLQKPFSGLRVVDLAWVGVGPTVSKYLADHGAEVIRVESATRPETLRRAGPVANGQDINNSPNVNGHISINSLFVSFC